MIKNFFIFCLRCNSSKLFYLLSVFVLLSVTYIPESGYAQYYTGPVSSGLGGAGRGASDEGEQILLNPAAIVHASPFTSDIFYQDGYDDKDQHDRVIGFGLADNTQHLLFSGGYNYISRRRTFPNWQTREENYHQFAMGNFIFEHLSMGVTLTYLETKVVGGGKYKQVDGNIGFLYNPLPDLGMGLVFYNVSGSKKNIPAEIQNLDKISFGVHYIFMPTFRVRADVSQQQQSNPDKKLQWQLGVESKFSEFTVARFGFEDIGHLGRKSYTLGLGFDGPRIKMDYFYRKNTDYNDGAMHGVDMRLPFW